MFHACPTDIVLAGKEREGYGKTAENQIINILQVPLITPEF